jgi:hypothetical protein
MSLTAAGRPKSMTINEAASERNLDGYDAPLIPWAKVRARLDQGWTQAPGTGGPDRHTCGTGSRPSCSSLPKRP